MLRGKGGRGVQSTLNLSAHNLSGKGPVFIRPDLNTFNTLIKKKIIWIIGAQKTTAGVGEKQEEEEEERELASV